MSAKIALLQQITQKLQYFLTNNPIFLNKPPINNHYFSKNIS